MSIALFVIIGVYCILTMLLIEVKSDGECSAFTLIIHIASMVTISSLAIACIVLLFKNLSAFADIDIDGAFSYASSQLCSEGPLQFAFEKAYSALTYERLLNRLALGFLIPAYAIQLLVCVCFTDLKYFLQMLFSRKKPQ